MEILVFKTNIRFKKQLTGIRPHLLKIPGIQQWNVDMHDKDKVLRIQSTGVAPDMVEEALRNAGYNCEELM